MPDDRRTELGEASFLLVNRHYVQSKVKIAGDDTARLTREHSSSRQDRSMTERAAEERLSYPNRR